MTQEAEVKSLLCKLENNKRLNMNESYVLHKYMLSLIVDKEEIVKNFRETKPNIFKRLLFKERVDRRELMEREVDNLYGLLIGGNYIECADTLGIF